MAQTVTMKARISVKDKFWLAAFYIPAMLGLLWLTVRFSQHTHFRRMDLVGWIFCVVVLGITIAVLVLSFRGSLVRARRKPVLKEWLGGFEKSRYHATYLRQTLEGQHPLAVGDPVELVREVIWNSRKNLSKIDEALAILILHGMNNELRFDAAEKLDSDEVRLWHHVLIIAQDARLCRTSNAFNCMGLDGFKFMSSLPPAEGVPAPVLFARAGWPKSTCSTR
jgi:hypothetical protein